MRDLFAIPRYRTKVIVGVRVFRVFARMCVFPLHHALITKVQSYIAISRVCNNGLWAVGLTNAHWVEPMKSTHSIHRYETVFQYM